MTTKEEIYDNQIAPLMSQIIAICKEHKIANICTFALPSDEDEGLQCTTVMLDDEFDPPEGYKKAMGHIMPSQSPMMVTVRDEGGNVKEMHAIL